MSVAPAAIACTTASSRSDSSFVAGNFVTRMPCRAKRSTPASPSESTSPPTRWGRSFQPSSASAPPSAATTKSFSSITARSDGTTSPCATTTALMTGKTKAAPERRSQGIPRVSTPYADITQIRFWGLRLSALSAPLSSGAPPSYSVVCVRAYAQPHGHEEDQARCRAWSPIDPCDLGATPPSGPPPCGPRRSRRRATARRATRRPGPRTIRRRGFPSLSPLDLVRGFAVLRGVEAEDFLALGHAQSDEDIDELEDHEGHDR